MQISGGSLRGRRLASPVGEAVRPTTGQVREALFSLLGERVAGARVLDLFAGAGLLGLEAMSRGAAAVCWVEQEPAVVKLVQANAAQCRLPEGSWTILPGRLPAVLGEVARQWGQADLVLLDPPYGRDLVGPVLAALAGHGLVTAGGVVAAELGGDDAEPLPPAGWRPWTSRRYGGTRLLLWRVAA